MAEPINCTASPALTSYVVSYSVSQLSLSKESLRLWNEDRLVIFIIV